MKKTWVLTRTLAVNRLRGATHRNVKEGGKKPKAGYALAMGLAGLVLLGYFGGFLYLLFWAAKGMGEAGAVWLPVPLSMAWMVAAFLGFITTLFLVYGETATGKDAALLYSLPVTYRQIFLSKLLFVWGTLVGIHLFAGMAALLAYGLNYGATVQQGLLTLLQAVLLPGISLAVGAIPALALTAATRKIRNRDRFLTVLTFGFFIAFMAVYVLGVAKISNVAHDEAVLQAILQSNVAQLGRMYAPGIWGAEAVLGMDVWANMAKLAAVGLGTLALTVLAGLAFFPRSAWASAENAAPRARRRAQRTQRGYSPVVSLALQEWRGLTRSPTYALNTFSGVVAMLALIFVYRIGMQGIIVESAAGALALPGAWVIMGAAVGLMEGMSPAASTCLSREGASLWRLRTLPISPKTFLWGKLLVELGIVCGSVILFMASFQLFFVPMPIGQLLGAGVLALVIGLPVSLCGMLADFLRPKLQWDTENEAIKQNLNVVSGLGLSWLCVAVIIAPVVLLMMYTQMPPWVLWITAMATAAACTAVLYPLTLRALCRQFPAERA